ncbi:M10 family metallopeptidase C-terminal domain-containing protein, partial [Rhizobiaceae sp. 2RAB30]
YTQDTLQWTIMSYWAAGADGTTVDRTGNGVTPDANGDGINAATPLLHDILAIQAKYGADMTTRTGNDTYGFNMRLSGPFRPVFDFTSAFNPNPVIAIWDAGGIDTLDVSGYSQNQRIDLAPGAISDVGALTLNVAIAYGTTIENAIGGSGNDRIKGNGANNTLIGGLGRDVLEGFD